MLLFRETSGMKLIIRHFTTYQLTVFLSDLKGAICRAIARED
jgi:hypothetical protein